MALIVLMITKNVNLSNIMMLDTSVIIVKINEIIKHLTVFDIKNKELLLSYINKFISILVNNSLTMKYM